MNANLILFVILGALTATVYWKMVEIDNLKKLIIELNRTIEILSSDNPPEDKID